MSPPRTAARKATFVSSLSLYEYRNRRQEDLLRKNKTPFTAAPLQRKTRTGLLMGTGNLPNKAENYRPFNPQALLVSISVLMLLPVPFGEGIPAVSYSPDMRPSELAGHFAVVLVVRVSIRVLIRVRKSMLVFGSRCCQFYCWSPPRGSTPKRCRFRRVAARFCWFDHVVDVVRVRSETDI
jgi:hypothetical protein